MQPITLTEAAITHIKHLAVKHDRDVAGIRLGVKNAGCSGMAYTVDFADEASPLDTVVEVSGVTVLLGPDASLYLIGTEIDYVEEKLHAGFVFNNPNEIGRCGCGESFRV